MARLKRNTVAANYGGDQVEFNMVNAWESSSGQKPSFEVVETCVGTRELILRVPGFMKDQVIRFDDIQAVYHLMALCGMLGANLEREETLDRQFMGDGYQVTLG